MEVPPRHPHEAERIDGSPRRFTRTSRRLTRSLGSLRWVFTLGFVVLVWLAVGITCGFPRWWELVVTVGFPFLTLLALAVIQHTQNHDSAAIELKLDELLLALDPTSDAMVRIEEASEADLERLQAHFGEVESRGNRATPRPRRPESVRPGAAVQWRRS